MIHNSACNPACNHLQLGGGVCHEGSEIFIVVGGVVLMGGSQNFKENLKLHNPSIKSIFRITTH